MIPFAAALNAFLIIYRSLPLAMRGFFVVSFLFVCVPGAVKVILSDS